MNNRLLVLLFSFILLSFGAFGQTCTLDVTLSATNTSICAGSAVVLNAGVAGGTGPFTYAWSTGETSPSISVNKGGTYTVTVTDKTPGCQPIVKNISIVEAVVPDAPTSNNVTVCRYTFARLTASAPGGVYQWYDAPVGGNFLHTGDTFDTPPLSDNTTYYVQTTKDGCTSLRTAVTAYVIYGPTTTPVTVCYGSPATLSAQNGDTYTWFDSATGGNQVGTGASFTTPPLTSTSTYYVVAVKYGCVSPRTPVTATVVPPPSSPTAASAIICSGSIANLHASAANGKIDWYDVPSGGTSLISSPDFTTPPLTATKTYYVQTTLNDCQSIRTAVTVTVNPLPSAPAAQTLTTCYGSATTITASATPTGSYAWFDAASGGHLLNVGNTYTTPALTHSATYYVQNTSAAGCTSDRTPIVVNVTPAIPAPTASGLVTCSGSVASLTATSTTGGTFQWYDAATGGVQVATGPNYITPALTADKTYYVETTVGGCTSARTAVPVTILAPVAAPTAPGTTICNGDQASLTASGAGSFAWYDSATGGNLLSSASNYTTPNLTATTTYYVQNTVNDCTSTRTPVTVTVNPVLAPPTASTPTPVCSGTSSNLTANGPAGSTLEWYDAPTGNLLATGNNFTTPAILDNTDYFVQSRSGSCVSTRTKVTATINSSSDVEFVYGSGTYSKTGPNPVPVIKNPSGATFTATPAGLVFVDNHTGEINLAASAPGNYTITLTSTGACTNSFANIINIINMPDSQFAYNGPYCQDGVNPLPTYAAGSGPGVFTASPSGLVFKSTTTGEIDLAKSAPGTYTVTNTIAGPPSSSNSTDVTINEAVKANAGPDQTVIAGNPVQLAGSVTVVSGGKWTGGNGTFSDPSKLNAVYTPAPGETSVTLTLTSDDPAGVCGPATDNVVITIDAVPPPPSAAGAAVCMGSVATLSATAPGGTYEWYSAATGGTLLQTGANYTSPPLTVNTTYYVQTTINGYTSPRTAVPVTVNQIPVAPTVNNMPVCVGSPAVLTASSPAGSYQWYDAVVGGHLLSLNATYTTPVLNANTTYYVQAVVNDCVSTRTQVDVVVNPIPQVISPETDNICSGNALNYTITADIPTATFLWKRDAVTGISNVAVANQTTALINEALVNTTGNPIDVTYAITPIVNGCSGATFNYVVTVYPSPIITSPASLSLCNNNASNYNVTFNTSGTNFYWGRDAVPGIANAAVAVQTTIPIREVLVNTTNAPVDVTYLFNYATNSCPGDPFKVTVTVNPSVYITSNDANTICSATAQNYAITANIPSATFIWKRDAVPGVSNPAVDNQTSSTITEALINTGTSPAYVRYVITPVAYGCQGPSFNYTVRVNPQPVVPIANANSPVCISSSIHLRTPTIPYASYLWKGPNGFTSTQQNPNIDNLSMAAAGTYTLFVSVDGCTSDPGTVNVVVNGLPVTKAGNDTLVCVTTASIQLAGFSSTGTGVWSTSGSGSFSPLTTNLNAQYTPSVQDKAAGSVTLTLTSTSKDDCSATSSKRIITFGRTSTVDAGKDVEVCSQDNRILLTGKITIPGGGVWSSASAGGSFTPSANILTVDAAGNTPDVYYIPGPDDAKNGSVKLTLTANDPGECYIPTDDMVIKFIPPPTVDAGGTRYVLENKTITLTPTVGDENVKYLWTPNVGLSDNTIKNPILTGTVDMVYTLTITDIRGCTNSSQTTIKVSPQITVPNTFTPNGDGHNDVWEIKGLIAYENASVDIFNRYGQKLFHSVGYGVPWDGTNNGQQLPVGTYYYVIDTKRNGQVLSGYVSIIR